MVCAAVPLQVAYGTWAAPVQHQRGVHLVADDARPVPHDDVAQPSSSAPGEHPAPRVVRLAQQHGARARRQRRVEPVEVEARRAVRDSGTGTRVRPVSGTTSRNGGYAGVGTTTGASSHSVRSASSIPLMTSGTRTTCAGSSAQDHRSAANLASASATPVRASDGL